MQKIGQSADKSCAYLLGVYLGDGCVTRPSTSSAPHRLCFKLNTIDEDFAEATRLAFENIGYKASISKHAVKNGRDNHSLYCGADDICSLFRGLTENKAVMPGCVWVWPRSDVLAFIVGLMDSEGFVAANKSNPTNRRFYMGFKSCDPWIPDFKDLMECVGIRTGKLATEKPRKPGYKTPRRFHVKMQSWIDSGARFNIARKQSRVDEWASAGPYEQRARYPRRLISEANTLGTQ